jgi:conjugative relaxase-like TrwC/TraI family protein
MVLSVKPFSCSKAAGKYYSHGDYYGKEGVGLWYGKGASELGFKSEFEAKTDKNFNNTLNGQMLNGQVLGRRTKEGIEHRPGYDLTFSCPKSFSIKMLLYTDTKQRQAMEQALMTAVGNTLDFIESKGYLIARKGQGGIEKEQIKNLIFAKFTYY